MILGIDIGIRNFAFAIATGTLEKWDVAYWDVIDLGIPLKSGKLRIVRAVHENLAKIPKIYKDVAIEMQPGKNRAMDYVEIATISYFISTGHTPISTNSREKYSKLFDCPCPKGNKNYQLRKNMAIEYIGKRVSGIPKTYFEAHEKKDDLADSLCIALVNL